MANHRLAYFAGRSFDAARRLDCLRSSDPESRLHGHRFEASVCATPNTPSGLAVDDLTDSLDRVLEPLRYCLINEVLEDPTDDRLLSWIRDKMSPLTCQSIGVQSTPDRGVEVDVDGVQYAWRRFQFEAAHQLPNVPEGHKCGRMHGHGFEVILMVQRTALTSPANNEYEAIERQWRPLEEVLNYSCLNDHQGLENPTSEMLSQWLWCRLVDELPNLHRVSVYETTTAGCHYDGRTFRIWKDDRFEAALRLSSVPSCDPRGRLHGHSYLVRLHLSAPLDDIMGWTIDYGDVKELFRPTYKLLDHQDLSRLPCQEYEGMAGYLYWIADRVREDLPGLDRIDLFQKSGCGGTISLIEPPFAVAAS